MVETATEDADHGRYKLNIWDVGGQKTIRSYWRNYFEKTDALIWVVDATDRIRMADCRDELRGLLLEEVCKDPTIGGSYSQSPRSGYLAQHCLCISTRPTLEGA